MTAKAANQGAVRAVEERGREDVRIDNGSAAAAGGLRSVAECLFRSEAHPLGRMVWVWVSAWCVCCRQGSVSDSERKVSLVSCRRSNPKLDSEYAGFKGQDASRSRQIPDTGGRNSSGLQDPSCSVRHDQGVVTENVFCSRYPSGASGVGRDPTGVAGLVLGTIARRSP